ncbi:MAG: helix-turn-helix domain-containing protein [Chloroflexi bacterium]|nr:helix-turn-helix domain-containing protein [Chloroflexota bacterium]
MHPRLGDLTADIQGCLEEEIPELRRDATTMELLGASIGGNVDTLLHAARYGIDVKRVQAPTPAVEYARRLAQHGVPVHALVRAYRIGQRRFNELVFDEVQATDVESSLRMAVLEKMSAAMFAYIDHISQQVVEVYEEERERWLENQNSLRAMRVREILAGKTPIDVDAASTRIRYPLRWHHLAVVLWYPETGTDGEDLPRLQRFLRELGEATGCGANPLFVPLDRSCGYGWLPFRSAAPEAIEKARQLAATRTDSPSVGIGTMGAGVGGFRRSHWRALAVHSVSIASGRQEHRVIAATDPGLSVAALVAGDVQQVRGWIADVLGDLAADTDSDARLRNTLRVFLASSGSYKLAADQLTLHSNTVKYRVGRATARRGRPITTDRLDVELALLLCHWYGKAVLQTTSPGH